MMWSGADEAVRRTLSSHHAIANTRKWGIYLLYQVRTDTYTFAYIGTNADTRQKYEYELTHLKECVVKIRAALAGDILTLILLLTSV